MFCYSLVSVVDLELGVRGKAENEGPLMTSPYSVNRDKTFYQA